jgi:cell wall-associated NlpC family hydrolase
LLKQQENNRFQHVPVAIEIEASSYLKGNVNARQGFFLDCSGYTRMVYAEFNINLPGSAKQQFRVCERLSVDDLQKGNLVFFRTNKRDISHAGIYLESNRFIHSPGKLKYVRIDSLTNPYWQGCFVCGGKPFFVTTNKLN